MIPADGLDSAQVGVRPGFFEKPLQGLFIVLRKQQVRSVGVLTAKGAGIENSNPGLFPCAKQDTAYLNASMAQQRDALNRFQTHVFESAVQVLDRDALALACPYGKVFR